MVHNDHIGAVHNPDADSGGRAKGEPIRVTDRARAQLVQVQVRVAKLEKARAKLVLVGVLVLLDKSVGLERLQQAVHRRSRQTEAVSQLAHPQATRSAGQSLE